MIPESHQDTAVKLHSHRFGFTESYLIYSSKKTAQTIEEVLNYYTLLLFKNSKGRAVSINGCMLITILINVGLLNK